MAVKNSVAPIPLSSIDSADFDDTYQLLTTAAGLPNAIQIMRISNDSGTGVLISYDGVTDHDFLIDGDQMYFNFQANSQPNTSIAKLSAGTKVYVKGAETSTGLVYLSGWYQVNN